MKYFVAGKDRIMTIDILLSWWCSPWSQATICLKTPPALVQNNSYITYIQLIKVSWNSLFCRHLGKSGKWQPHMYEPSVSQDIRELPMKMKYSRYAIPLYLILGRRFPWWVLTTLNHSSDSPSDVPKAEKTEMGFPSLRFGARIWAPV